MTIKNSERFNIQISVIIPVYNVEKYLKQCLNSIIMQSFKNFEIICINDGSTDNSLDILENYAKQDNRLRIINQKNSGAGNCRNTGIELAKGKYIICLDSDDYFEPDFLKEMFSVAEKYDTDITICSAKKIDEFNNIIERGNPLWPYNRDRVTYNKIFSWRDYKNEIFDLFNVIPWNKLYKKDFIVNNKLKYQNLTSCNDVSFSHKARILANKIIIFDKELINYRHFRNNSISQYRGAKATNAILSAIELKTFLEENNLFQELETSYINGIKNILRAELSYCNKESIKILEKNLKSLMPNYWFNFSSIFEENKISLEDIERIIGNKKVMFWGASLFLKKLLSEQKSANENILGIIDMNNAAWGKQFIHYKIYSPEILKINPPEKLIVSVYNNNEKIYNSIKNELKTNFIELEVINLFQDKN